MSEVSICLFISTIPVHDVILLSIQGIVCILEISNIRVVHTLFLTAHSMKKLSIVIDYLAIIIISITCITDNFIFQYYWHKLQYYISHLYFSKKCLFLGWRCMQHISMSHALLLFFCVCHLVA